MLQSLIKKEMKKRSLLDATDMMETEDSLLRDLFDVDQRRRTVLA